MFRFRIGSIPVTIEASHLIVAAVFGWMFVGVGAGQSIRSFLSGDVVVAAGDPSYAKVATFAVAAWMAIIFVSVLVHELGHAVTMAALRLEPEITLAWLGGHTRSTVERPLPWYQRVAFTLAGPVAGGLLGVAAFALSAVLDGPPFLQYVLQGAAIANFFWAILNLVPVAPLDGSHIANAVLMRMFGPRGFLFAQVIGLICGAALALWGLRTGALFIALIFGMGAFDAFRMISAYLKGEVNLGDSPSPHLDALEDANRKMIAGDLDAARAAAERVSDGAPPPIRARAHHLLGEIALRRKAGREALDHFSQAGAVKVAPEALATAFSLVGDDDRAAKLWEHAYRERRDARAAQHWAASLLLLGRIDEVRRTSADLPTAYRLAARKSYDRGDFRRAAEMNVESLERSPSQEAAYDAACALARAGDTDGALKMLHRARDLGFSAGDHASADPDLASLQGRAEFDAWLASLRNPARA